MPIRAGRAGFLADNTSSQPNNTGRQDAVFEAGWVRYVELALGYLGFLILIVYPVALATSWVRLLDEFSYVPAYAPAISLYAVSLMPNTVVVASTGLWLLYYSLFSGGIAFLTAGAVSQYRLSKMLQQGQDDVAWRRVIPSGWRGLFFKYGMFISLAIMAPLLPFGFAYSFSLESQFDYMLYILYLVATILGGVISTYVGEPGTSENSRWRAFAGAAIIYVGIIVGAVSLNGVTPLTLPNVQFNSQAGVEEGRLLGHSKGYWYVLNDKEILAIPDDDAGSQIRIMEPQRYESPPKPERD
jgi:hypothetical protein